MKDTSEKILVGNTFPLTLVRGHRVACEEIPIDALRARLAERPVASTWGHANTRAAAEAILRVSLAPAVARPVLALDDDDYPVLDGERFEEAYVLSPDYVANFRPAVGEEVAPGSIRAWHALRLTWD